MRWTEPHSRSSSSSKSLPRCRREVSVPRLEAGCRTPLPATTPKAPPTPNDIKRATPPSPTSHSPVHHQCKRIPASSFVHSEPDLLTSVTSVTRSIRSVQRVRCHHAHSSTQCKRRAIIRRGVVIVQVKIMWFSFHFHFHFLHLLPVSFCLVVLLLPASRAASTETMPCHAMHGLHTTYAQIQYQRADIHPHSIPTIIPSIQTPPPPPPSSPPLPHRHVGQILLRRCRPPSLPHYEYTAR